MSKQIENNVVQMTFDNKDFEKNISTSSKSIEKLNEQLKFKDASDGFKNLEKMANAISFGGLEKAINNINSVFTVTGNLSHKIIDDIAGYFENKIVGTVNTVRSKISYIMDPNLGMTKYEQYNTALNTMAGNLSDMDRHWLEMDRKRLGENIEEFEYAEKYIQQIAAYSDETSYSLTDMVDTMSKFAAANVNLKDSSSAMQGFANMAAVAGQNSKVASAAMYQLAQSFNTGYVKYQDWQQALGLKNIATKEAKEIFVQAALKAGTLDDKDIARAKQELGAENYINWFYTSKNLNEGQWLETGTVLVEGLKEYSKASDYIFENLDSMGNIGVSEILRWTKDYKKIGGSLDEYMEGLDLPKSLKKDNIDAIRSAIEKLSSAEYDLSLKAFMAAQQATNFHEALDAVRDAVGTKMMYAFKWFFGDLEQSKELWTGLAESLWDVFAGPLDSALLGLEEWNRGVHTVNEGVEELFDNNYDMFWESIGRIFSGIGSIFTGLTDQFKIINGVIDDTGEALGLTDIVENNTLRFMRKLTTTMKRLADGIEKFVDSAFYKNLQGIVRNLAISAKNIKGIISRLLSATVGTAIKNIGKPLTTLSEIVMKLTEKFAYFTGKILGSQTFNDIAERIAKIVEKLMGLGNAILKVFGDFMLSKIEAIGRILNKIFEFLKPGIDWLLKKIDDNLLPALDELAEGPYSVGAAFEWLMEKLAKAKDSIKDFVKETLNINFEDAKEKISGFGQHVKDTFTSKGSNIVDILRSYIETNFSKDSKGSLPNLLARIAEAETAMDGVKEGIKWTGDAITKPISLVLDIVGELIGVDLSKLSDGFSKFVHAITDGLAEISPNVLNMFKTVGGIFLDILGFVFQLITSIFKFLTGSVDTSGYQTLDNILVAIKMLIEGLVDIFTHALMALGTLVKLIGPGISKAIDLVVDIIRSISTMIKEMFQDLASTKDPDKLLDYMWSLVKFFIGFVVIAKIIQVVSDTIWFFGGLRKSVRELGLSVYAVSDSIAGFFDTLGGYSVQGMLLYFSTFMFSIGYALSKIVKAGEAMSDPKLRTGIIAAFASTIVLMALMLNMTKSLMKYQKKLGKQSFSSKAFNFLKNVKISKSGIKYNPQENKTDNNDIGFQSTIQFLVGMAVAMVGISLALSILSKACEQVSTESMVGATTAISIMMLVMSLVLKMTKVQQKSSNVSRFEKFGEAFGYKSKKDLSASEFEGGTYKGVAGAMLSMAGLILLLTPPLIMLALAAKILGKNSINAATTAVMLVLGVVGLVIRISGKYAKDASWGQLISISIMFKAMEGLLVTVAIIIAGLALVLSHLVDPKAYNTIITISVIMLAFFATIGGIMIKLMKQDNKDLDLKKAITQLTRRVARILVASAMFTSLAIAVASIAGVIGILVYAVEKIKELNPGGKTIASIPVEIFAVVGLMVAILSAMTVFTLVIAKNLKGTGKGKSALAKGGVIAVLILEFVGILLVIAGAVTLLALAIGHFDDGEIGKALALVLGITALITVMMVVITMISNALAGKKGGKNTKVKSGAKEILALAAAILVMTTAIMTIAFGIVALANAFEAISAPALTKAIIAFVLAAAGIIGVMFAMKYAGEYAGQGIKILAGALLKLIAVVALGLAAIALVKFYGDDIISWAEKNSDKVREVFRIIGDSFMNMIVGILDGLVKSAPDMLEALGLLIDMLLKFLNDHAFSWAYDILCVIEEILRALEKKFSEEQFIVTLGKTVSAFLSALLGALIVAFVDFFDQLDAWFNGGNADMSDAADQSIGSYTRRGKELLEDFMGWLVETAVPNIFDSLAGVFEWVDEHTFNLSGPAKQMNDNMQQWMEEYDNKEAEQRRKRAVETVKPYVEEIQKYMKYLQAYNSSVSTSEKQYYSNLLNTVNYDRIRKSVGLYNMQNHEYYNLLEELGYNTTTGFIMGLNNGASMEAIGRRWMNEFIDGGKTAAQIKSPSRVTMRMGYFIDQGLIEGIGNVTNVGKKWMDCFLEGACDEAGIHSNSDETISIGKFLMGGLKEGLGNSKETGQNFMDRFITGIRDTITNSGIAEQIKNSINLSNITDGAGALTSGFQIAGFSTELSPVYSLDSVSQPTYETDYDYSLDTTAAVDSIDTLDNTVYDSNSDLVNEVKGLREEMAKYAEAIEQIQMVLDTGALVGELVAPMDKALGERNDRKAARGI